MASTPETKAKRAKKASTKAAEDAATETSAPAKGKKSSRKTATTSTGKTLIVVESPTKAKTLKKYMGKDYEVRASVGHLVDLPKSKLGVDLENNFEPTYVVIKGKADVLKELKEQAKYSDRILLATDPDREGEAIAWHIADKLSSLKKPVERVEFHEITKKAVQEAIKHPRALDHNRFEAQQARRILDRLVGYKLSPLLWTKVRRGLSAGRVQSVAVRLIVEREREVRAFVPEEYWSIAAEVAAGSPPVFLANLNRVGDEKPVIPNKEVADALTSRLESASYKVSKVERKERRRRPSPAFTTSQLQQEAARKLRFPAKKTMMLAQRLYEGQEIGDEGSVGLITYMRTDSVRLADEAVAAVRQHILEKYGKDYLPDEPNVYKSRKGAQEAHEAIRPTSVDYSPDKIKNYLGRDELRLYKLIWNRFVSCQMSPAVYDQTSIDIAAETKDTGPALSLRATGSILKFAGFTKVYTEGHDEGDVIEEGEEGDRKLPEVAEGDVITLQKLLPEQHFTQPPPRFSEASLVKALEERGIGRPSTYAAILSNIQDKRYVTKQENRFYPSEMGNLVNDLLVEHFPTVLDANFTAQMEDELDDVAEGKRTWVNTLNDFYQPFKVDLEKAESEMRNVKTENIETEFKCDKCGSPMVLKWGRFGEFLACSKYPECKKTMNVKRAEDGSLVPIRPEDEYQPYPGKCDVCGDELTLRKAWTGSRYIACKKYKDDCTFTKPFPIGVKCPDCGGEVVERASKRRKIFFGCGNYPNCTFVSWYPPIAEPCPKCGSPFLVEKRTKRKGHHLACPNKECDYERLLEDENEEDAEAQTAEAGA